MSYIFSYSHSKKDSTYAHKLVKALEEKGFSVWIDDQIDYGTRWPDVIEEKLEGCGAFIVIMSPRSKESFFVQCEVTRAIGRGKPLFPLLFEGDESWLIVAAIQYVDVRGGKLPTQSFFSRLADAVPRRSTSTPASKPKSKPKPKPKPKPPADPFPITVSAIVEALDGVMDGGQIWQISGPAEYIKRDKGKTGIQALGGLEGENFYIPHYRIPKPKPVEYLPNELFSGDIYREIGPFITLYARGKSLNAVGWFEQTTDYGPIYADLKLKPAGPSIPLYQRLQQDEYSYLGMLKTFTSFDWQTYEMTLFADYPLLLRIWENGSALNSEEFLESGWSHGTPRDCPVDSDLMGHFSVNRSWSFTAEKKAIARALIEAHVAMRVPSKDYVDSLDLRLQLARDMLDIHATVEALTVIQK